MKHITVKTKNMRRLIQAVDDLLNRFDGLERMGLLWAPPGEGKTTAVAYCYNKYNGIFIRALSCSTTTSILSDLCFELGGKRNGRKTNMVRYIIDELTGKGKSPRPIFVDESDYLFKQIEMVEILRDIYDGSKCPVILVGMEDIARRIKTHGRIRRRITEWVEFKGLDIEDTTLVARECCEIGLSSDLLEYLHKETGANIGRIINGLCKIETFAKANGFDEINYDQWGERPLDFDPPPFNRKR